MTFAKAAAGVAATVTLSLLATPAGAATAAGGCQQGFDLVSLRYVLSQATAGSEDDIRAMDANRDKLLCYKLLPTAIPLFEPTFLYYDNDQPL